jgi:hypothetical protein
VTDSVRCEASNVYVVILAQKFRFIYCLIIFATIFRVFEISVFVFMLRVMDYERI